MNNEPVAWMQVHYKDGIPTKFSTVQTWEDDVPLYTHPAKTLTDEEFDNIFANGKRLGVLETEDRFRNAMNLTDEEIEELSEEHLDMDWQTGVIDFARAILRKAQEK